MGGLHIDLRKERNWENTVFSQMQAYIIETYMFRAINICCVIFTFGFLQSQNSNTKMNKKSSNKMK